MLQTQIGQCVFIAAFALDFSGIGVKHARLPDKVEREIGIGEFFLELGVRRDQLDHTLTENQRVVTKPRDIRLQYLLLCHRFSTPSGIS